MFVRWMRVLGIALLASAAPAGLAAETRALPAIEVSGRGLVEAPPDLALLDFGVMTRAPTAEAAARENSIRMDAAVAAVRKALGPKAQIRTGSYALRPEHVFPREGGVPKVTGYVATNVMQLRTPELARLGEIIDLAIKAGANQVQRVAFTLSDQSGAQRQALEQAVVQARSKAHSIAAALGLKLGPIHTIVEHELGDVRPLMLDAAVARAEVAPVTPLEPGLIEVRARVALSILLVH
jgi:uncharacterized protein